MGTVDSRNCVNFYDGEVRVVDSNGDECDRFTAADYLDHIAEQVETWSYLKFAYLKRVGWPGLHEETYKDLVRVGPLARLNAADGMATPLAQAQYEKMYATFKGKPVHNTLAFHWARLIELLYGAERLQELSADPMITSPDVRALPTETPTEGAGIIEAPRGTLIHHFRTDSNGMVKGVNLVVATGLNYAAICGSITKIAKALITDGHVTDGILNKIEMAFRAYDPCMSCATHSLPGRMALSINIRNSHGEILENLRND
jgi:F420-non-reducing hydrogenase large subunit